MAEYTPVSKVNYNLFKQNYDPNVPYNKQSETILQKYNEDLFNKYSSIASEEPKLGFFDKLGSGLENLFSAYGAEKPQVPNLSLGYNTPTFDLGTGITNTTAATNMYTPFMSNQEMVNKDLVDQLIQENLIKANIFSRPNMMNIAGDVIPGGITDIDLMKENQLPYSGVGDMRYSTPRTIADQNRVLGQTFTEPKKSNGIMDAIMSVVIPGYNFIKNLGSGQPYEQFTPGGTIRNGIYSIDGVNVPVSSFGGDFYNPNTGLNRFDRAAERFKKTGSMLDLFGSSRTGKEFFEKRREIEAKKQKDLEEAAKKKRQFKQDTGGGSGRDSDTTSGPSSGTGRGATSATSSSLGDLGFSDKRLKENIELIGKSPSNINIYKFNYKNNPTTFQGVMADEVSWASVKHPNGYMMVDYNKIDVEFKKI
jgi:hypothetical protein